MNETIHYISPLSYITDISHLKKHIKYITRQQARPFTTIDNEKINAWIEKAKEEKRKRIDARVAMKFVIAIPNDRKDDISFFKKVGYFLEEFFQVDRDNIDLTVHRDNEENIHMHVLVYPRRTDGKKLRLTKNDLRNWHKKWDEFLEREGYTVVRDKVEERLNHLGWKLHADPELKASYTEYKQNKKQIKQIHNNIQKTQQIDTILTDLRKLKLALEIELKVRTIEERVANRVRAKQQQTQTQAIATYQKPIQANQQNNLQKPIQQKQIQANLKEPSLAQAIQQIQQQKANTQEEEEEERKRKKAIECRMRVIRENQTKLASLGRMFFILQEAKKMEEQEKEMKERILVLDMLLSQLKNKKQILETEAQKKKVQDEYISKTKRIMQENKIRLLALGRQFYELVEAKIERQRQEERIYKIRIITETKIKLVTMGRQFYELEGEGEKDKEKANDILKKLDNKLDSIKKNIEQIKQAKESKGKQANEQQTNAPRNILEREIFGIGDEEIEESPEKPESPRNTDTENIFDIDIDI